MLMKRLYFLEFDFVKTSIEWRFLSSFRLVLQHSSQSLETHIWSISSLPSNCTQGAFTSSFAERKTVVFQWKRTCWMNLSWTFQTKLASYSQFQAQTRMSASLNFAKFSLKYHLDHDDRIHCQIFQYIPAWSHRSVTHSQ